jgi:hypothetical protein
MIGMRIDDVGPAELVHFAGEVVLFASDRAFAPGKPLDVHAAFSDGELPFKLKVLGSRRRDDSRFDVRARVINLTRELRERLQRAFAN